MLTGVTLPAYRNRKTNQGESAMQDVLFQPITINNMEIKNRIYLPAMHLGMAVDFQVTDQLTAFYAERARGGVGMICVGYATAG
jgi:2,4-dienoyl-CoA reductase (NADPH2)